MAKQMLVCGIALFGVLLSVVLLGVVSKWTIRESAPWVIPTRVVLDASEKADTVMLLVDAQMGTADKALHVVLPRGGKCSVQGRCASESRGQCTLAVANIQEFAYPDDSHMRFAAAVEQAWLPNMRAALEQEDHGMALSCELSIDVDLFTSGYIVTKQMQWRSNIMQLEKGCPNCATPRFRIKQLQTHKHERMVQSKTASNFIVAKHFVAELTLPMGSMVTALESTSVGVNAHVGYRDAEMNAIEGNLVVNSNVEMLRNASGGEAVLTLPFHMLLRADLPSLAKGAFLSSIRPATQSEDADTRHSTLERTMLLEASPQSRAAASMLGNMHSIQWSSERRETLKRNQLTPASYGDKMPPGPRRLISIFGLEDILGIELQNLLTSHRLRINDNDVLKVELSVFEGPPIVASVNFELQSLTETSVAAKASLTLDDVQETIKTKVSVLVTSKGKVDFNHDLTASVDLKAENADAVIMLQLGEDFMAEATANYLGQEEKASANVNINGGDDFNATATISGDFDDLIFLVDATMTDVIKVKIDGREDDAKVDVWLLDGDKKNMSMKYTRKSSQDTDTYAVSMDMAEEYHDVTHKDTKVQAVGNSGMTMAFELDHGRRRSTATGGLRKGLGSIRMTPTCQATGSDNLTGNAAVCNSQGKDNSCCKDGLQDIMVGLVDMDVGTTWGTTGLDLRMTDIQGTSEDMDITAYWDISDNEMPLAETQFRVANGRNTLTCTVKESSTSVIFVSKASWKELSDGYTGTFALDGSPKDGQMAAGEISFNGEWDGNIDVSFHVDEKKDDELIRGVVDWNRKPGWDADLNATVHMKIDDKKQQITALVDMKEANDVKTVGADMKLDKKPVASGLVHMSDGGDALPCFVNATIYQGEDSSLLARAYANITNPAYALGLLDNRQITMKHPIQGYGYLDIEDERIGSALANVKKDDIPDGSVVKTTVQLMEGQNADPKIAMELKLATTDSVQMEVTGELIVDGTEEMNVTGTLKEQGDWRGGDITIKAGSDEQLLWANGSRGFLTQEKKPPGFDALWFNFGTEIESDVRVNLTDLYIERGPDVAWSGWGLKCQLFEKNSSNNWQELYNGKLEVGYVPGAAPVRQGDFAATNLEVAMTVGDVNDMKVTDVIKAIAESSGVSPEDVVVKEMKFQILVEAEFDASVTKDQARTTIARANDVNEAQVKVTEKASRRLSAGLLAVRDTPTGGRRLATRVFQSEITTLDATKAAEVQTSAADTTKLTQALNIVVPAAPPPKITMQPKVKVAIQTQVMSTSSTPVAPPSQDNLMKNLEKNMGQTVEVEVADKGSTSCSGGVCAQPGDEPTPAPTPAPTLARAAGTTGNGATVPCLAVTPLLLALILVPSNSLSA